MLSPNTNNKCILVEIKNQDIYNSYWINWTSKWSLEERPFLQRAIRQGHGLYWSQFQLTLHVDEQMIPSGVGQEASAGAGEGGGPQRAARRGRRGAPPPHRRRFH